MLVANAGIQTDLGHGVLQTTAMLKHNTSLMVPYKVLCQHYVVTYCTLVTINTGCRSQVLDAANHSNKKLICSNGSHLLVDLMCDCLYLIGLQ